MYISLNWLKDFVKIPAKIDAASIARELTSHTVEVEGLINQAEQFNKVVVGKVLEVKKHPNADRLRLALVDIKKTKLNIVCGAPNLAEGQLVPVALVGAVLPGGLEIKESEIRGEKSSGMICAEDELGLGKGHDGIIVLASDAKIGEAFAKYLKANDTVLEVDNKSLSNRPDLLNHYGIAREIGVIFDLVVKPYDKFLNKKFEFLSTKENKLEVKVEDKEACPRYMAIRVENLEVKESPAWLKEKLIAVNQKPINNIVDLTNYVMLECGQPLHSFNAGDIEKIVVRRAKKNEVFETLDEKERNLNEEDLLITDGKKAIALAGIMGGKESGIVAETKNIILESANFKAAFVRKTSQRLGLRTEASTRYEKALDANLTETALFRFLTLLHEMCPDMKIASALIDVRQVAVEIEAIELDLAWLTKKIGLEIPKEKIIKTLSQLGFKLSGEDTETLVVGIPSWRATKDISSKEDLAEEVLRIYGYDNIPSQLPYETLRLPEINEERQVERKIKNILALKHDLSEVYNYSFVGEDQLKKLNIDFFNYLKLANPLSDIQTILRQSLVPNLINNIKTNQFKADSLAFFEIGGVFFNAPGSLKKEATGDSTIPYQEKHLGIILAGEETDLFGRVKGIVSSLIKDLITHDAISEFVLSEEFPGWADNKIIAKIKVYGREIGVVAVLNKAASDNVNLKKPVVIAEINFKDLFELIFSAQTTHFKELAKYPAVVRDFAFVIKEKILYNEFKHEIVKFNSLIKEAELFDVYVGNKLAADEKSLAFHLTFQSEEKTLLNNEVDLTVDSLIKHLAEKFEARLRD
ncbi:MAG: phenylalanine--tRNA ligase subunit beta [Candidatus Falkowbacteria bacterium]